MKLNSQILRKGAALMIVLSSQLTWAFSSENELRKALQKPLITGASVSADSRSLSPGKKLALQYTRKEEICTLAFGGRPGAETIKSINENALKDRMIALQQQSECIG